MIRILSSFVPRTAFNNFSYEICSQVCNPYFAKSVASSRHHNTTTMQIPLLQVLLCLAAIWNGIAAATPLQFTLYHQVLHPASAIENADKGITPRGTILYETTTRTATYEPQSPSLDLSKDSGVYRIGLYNDKTKHLAPVAFTKLVRFSQLYSHHHFNDEC